MVAILKRPLCIPGRPEESALPAAECAVKNYLPSWQMPRKRPVPVQHGQVEVQLDGVQFHLKRQEFVLNPPVIRPHLDETSTRLNSPLSPLRTPSPAKTGQITMHIPQSVFL